MKLSDKYVVTCKANYERRISMIDLHLHLDGSLTPEIVIKLAKLQGLNLPSDNDEDLRNLLTVPKNCESLNDYLKCFDLPLSLLQEKDAITLCVKLLFEHLDSLGYQYCEIRFAPQLHQKHGLSQEEVVKAVLSGRDEYKKEHLDTDFDARFILCMMRGNDNKNENFETIETAKEFLGKGVVALDLAGAEGLFPTKNYKEEFQTARQYGIPFTIHAGEADGVESVRTAIESGAKRIGHGIRAMEDLEVMRLLKEKEITLELCPTSNIQTKAVPSWKEYPLKRFMDYGILVTINSDNLMVSDTNVKKELELIQKEFQLSENEINILKENSKNAIFR